MAARKAKKTTPSFDIELHALGDFDGVVCGVDEAGRGPLAGPVIAAAVAIPAGDLRRPLASALQQLNDSKALKEDVRSELYEEIVRTFDFAVGIADVARIDRDNILQATLWSMREAVSSLKLRPDVALVDGNRDPGLNCETQLVVGGDAKCLSIAAASIIAKVT
ncbi:MAG: ribonuclease HII, partial [Pseudomonadota bacterium]